jgi:REP-associated tyrosine transposase
VSAPTLLGSSQIDKHRSRRDTTSVAWPPTRRRRAARDGCWAALRPSNVRSARTGRGQVLQRNTRGTETCHSRASSTATLEGMARPLRIEFAGALYHVTARGNERKPIVRDDDDREQWVTALARVISRFGWLVYAYCLMDNHFHLVVETPKPNLARGMRELNSVYAQRFNRRHRRSGHLFGGRYGALLVQREPHLLEASRYVVLNPERVSVPTRSYDRYRWSSYRATAGLEPAPDFLACERLLELFDCERARAVRAYRAFVRDGRGRADPKREGVSEVYLGDMHFIRRRQPRRPRSSEVPRRQREPMRCSLEELLRERSDDAVALAYREHGYSLRELAAELGVHYSTVSRRLRAEERALGVP